MKRFNKRPVASLIGIAVMGLTIITLSLAGCGDSETGDNTSNGGGTTVTSADQILGEWYLDEGYTTKMFEFKAGGKVDVPGSQGCDFTVDNGTITISVSVPMMGPMEIMKLTSCKLNGKTLTATMVAEEQPDQAMILYKK